MVKHQNLDLSNKGQSLDFKNLFSLSKRNTSRNSGTILLYQFLSFSDVVASFSLSININSRGFPVQHGSSFAHQYRSQQSASPTDDAHNTDGPIQRITSDIYACSHTLRLQPITTLNPHYLNNISTCSVLACIF